MNLNSIYKYEKVLKHKKSDFRSKSDFVDFLKFLNNRIRERPDNESESCFQMLNEDYRIQSDNLNELYNEISNANSILEIDMEIRGKQSGLHFSYRPLNLFKNNCKIVIYSYDSESLDLLHSSIHSELNKYNNAIRVLFYKFFSILIFLSVLTSLFLTTYDFNNLTSDDFRVDSSFFLDFLIVVFLPVFVVMFFYNTSVPTIRIRKNSGLLNGIKSYIKQDFKSIIKDILLAIFFLAIGSFFL